MYKLAGARSKLIARLLGYNGKEMKTKSREIARMLSRNDVKGLKSLFDEIYKSLPSGKGFQRVR